MRGRAVRRQSHPSCSRRTGVARSNTVAVTVCRTADPREPGTWVWQVLGEAPRGPAGVRAGVSAQVLLPVPLARTASRRA